MVGRPTALITGASSGIGLALSKRLADRFDLVLGGRRVRPFDLPENARYVQADLLNPASAVGQIDRALREAGVDRLDRLIVNAGIGYYRSADAESPEVIRNTLDLNLYAPILLARHFAPLLEGARGKLVLIGSVAHRGSANMPSYAASKAGLAGFARSLDAEWRGRIAVQVIHPGPTVTEMHEKAGYDPGRLKRLFFSAEAMAAEIDRLMQSRRPSATVGVGSRLRRMIAGRRS